MADLLSRLIRRVFRGVFERVLEKLEKLEKYCPGLVPISGTPSLFMGLLISVITATLTIASIYGSDASAMTLNDAVEKALSTSDQIRVIEEERNRSAAEARKVDTFTRMRLDTSLACSELGTSADDNPFFSSPDRDMKTGLTASRLLWAGGRIANSHGLRDDLITLAALEEISLKRDLVTEVSISFLEVLYQRARLDILKDRVGQRRDELSDATDLFEAGMVTNLDVREASLNLNIARDDLRSGENSFHTFLVDFNLALGEGAYHGETLLTPRGTLVRPGELTDDLARLEFLFSKERQLDLIRAETGINIAAKELDIVRGERFPEIAFVSGAEYGGESVSDMEMSWQVGAKVTWNILDGGAKDAATASSLAQKKSRQATLLQTRKRLSGAINRLKAERESLGRRIALQEKSVQLSNGNYEDARGLYGTGTMTLTRLGDFNLLYAEVRFNLIRLYYLENLIGIEVKALIYGRE